MNNPFLQPFSAWRPAHIITFLFFLLLVFLCALTALNLAHLQHSEQAFLQNRRIKLDRALSIHAWHMREQVINVQQWLTDISATRGLDGLDDGFDQARQSANRFRSGLATLRTILGKRHSKPDHVVDVDALSRDFDTYFATGTNMARAYMESGTLQGNPIMKRFDAEASALQKIFETLAKDFRARNLSDARQIPMEEPTWFRLARIWRLMMGRDTYATYAQTQRRLWLTASGGKQSQLAMKAQELREDILQIQQWLTDVSATRARDGMDDGFHMAQARANHFLSHLGPFRTLVRATGQPSWIATVDQIEHHFHDYYAVGLRMADAYIKAGTVKGNAEMRVFDQQAAKLIVDLRPFLEGLLEKAGLQAFQEALVQQAIADMIHFLWALLGVLFLLTLGTLWGLFR